MTDAAHAGAVDNGKRRVAAIDCGTNSVRLLVADLPAPDAPVRAPLTDLVRRMEIVRLGAGVDRTGRLAPEAIERTRVALADYATQAASFGVDRMRMVATSASRDASNAADFRAMVRATIGIEPEVISGDEEARLSFSGAVRGLSDSATPPYLVVDIGGGSTEFATGTDAVERATSIDIGSVRVTERHFATDPPTAVEIVAAERDIAASVRRALDTVAAQDANTLVGLAGSVTTVAGIALGLDAYDPGRTHRARISLAQVNDVTSDLLRKTSAERRAIPVMHPGRADVIAAGALILRTVMVESGADVVVASEHDILDGIAWSLA